MMKKILSTMLGLAMLATVIYAGTVNLAWDDNPLAEVTRYRVYAVKGTNTAFTAGNANATVVVTVTNQLTASITNLASGAWTFAATAVSTNGTESANSNTVWTNVPLSGVVNFRITSTTP